MSDETTRTVTCADCRRVLDEDPGLTSKPPCPHCGSTERLIKVELTARVRAFAELVGLRTHVSVTHSSFWLAVLVGLAVCGVLAKWLLPFWLALVVAVAVVALSFIVRPRASARVIERERFHA